MSLSETIDKASTATATYQEEHLTVAHNAVALGHANQHDEAAMDDGDNDLLRKARDPAGPFCTSSGIVGGLLEFAGPGYQYVFRPPRGARSRL